MKQRFSLAVSAAALVLAVLGLTPLGEAAGPSATAAGYVLTQRNGSKERIVTLIASTGAKTTVATRKGRRFRALTGTIVDYRGDGTVFLLDPARRRYSSVSLRGRLRELARDRALVKTPTFAVEVYRESGVKPPPKGAKFPAARLHPGRSAMVAGLRARVYVLRTGKRVERLWFALDLPRAPKVIRDALRRYGASGGRGSADRALRSMLDATVLRRQLKAGRRWKTLLDTVRVRRTPVRESTFSPPRGYRKQSATDQQVAPAGVPASVVRWFGPVAGKPEIFAVYWGSTFSGSGFPGAMNAFLTSFMRSTGGVYKDAYWPGLAQYGIQPNGLLGSVAFANDPPATVGSWNFIALEGVVARAMDLPSAPKLWWSVGGHDPIYAIFIPSEIVDSSGWGGYHAFAPTPAGLAPPWPTWLLLRPAIPWLVAKVNAPVDPTAVSVASFPFSHELVEASSDPYPFSSWFDPLKQPVWSEAELADICSVGSFAPFGSATRVFPGGALLATYWSQNAGACVPASRPSLSISSPSNGARLRAGRILISAAASDPVDGTPDVRWTLTGPGTPSIPSGTSAFVRLGSGSYTLTATASNTGGGTATPVTIGFTVFADPPVATLISPANNSTLALSAQATFKATATDPQDGALSGNSFQWRVDGTPLGTRGTTVQHTWGTAADHTVSVTATDSFGLSKTVSALVHVIDTTDKPPIVAITNPANNAYFYSQTANVHFTATASDPDETIPDASISWFDSIDGRAEVPLGTGRDFMKTIAQDQADTNNSLYTKHEVRVIVTDSQGLTATDFITVYVGLVIT